MLKAKNKHDTLKPKLKQSREINSYAAVHMVRKWNAIFHEQTRIVSMHASIVTAMLLVYFESFSE